MKLEKTGKVVWDLILCSIFWSIWLARNECRFNGAQPDWEVSLENVKCKVAFWAKLNPKFESFSVSDFSFHLHSIVGRD